MASGSLGCRIGINVGGDLVGTPIPPAEIVAQIERAEADGFGSVWTVHLSRGYDALTVLAAAGPRTSSVELAVGVVPTYPRHPLALAQQAVTAQALSGGRLTLGVGVSHRPVIEDLHGLRYESPAAHLSDYLAVLGPLLREKSVTHRGRYYQVDGGFTVVDAAPVSVVVGALSPRMVRVAGESADGVVTWLAGPHSIADIVVPALREGAAGQPRRLVAGVPVAVTADAAAARGQAEQVFGRYNAMENYRRVFEREQVASVSELAVIGTEEEVEQELTRFAEAGTTDIWAVPFGDDEQARRTSVLLAGLGAR